jgi:integrase
VPQEWRLFVEFLAHTGLRFSEAIALRWGDVDFKQQRLHVRRLYHGIDAPKSRHGRRDIPLAPRMLATLEHRRHTSNHQGESDPVFATRTGTPLDYARVYNRVLKPAARRAGVPWAAFHTLRHTCATMLFRNGLNAKQVQIWLGHHSPAFTLAVYVHLLPDDLPNPDFLDTLTGRRRVKKHHRQQQRARVTGPRNGSRQAFESSARTCAAVVTAPVSIPPVPRRISTQYVFSPAMRH